MHCLVVTPHRLGIPEMAKHVRQEWDAMGRDVEYVLADGAAARIGPITVGAPGIALWWYRTLKRVAADHEQYDLIWTHQPVFPRLPTTDATFWNKVVATTHTTLIREYELVREGVYPRKLLPYYWFASTIEARSHRRLTGLSHDGPHYTVVSPHLREEVAPFGVEEATYVLNGVFTPEQDAFEPIRAEHGIPEDATVVFNVGSLTNQKRPVRFAELLGTVADDLEDTHVVMAGDGPLREAVEAHASDRLHVLGYVSDEAKWRWFADADVFASAVADLPGEHSTVSLPMWREVAERYLDLMTD
jgi:glycosyltransferase involved in cell wall biosynthesis